MQPQRITFVDEQRRALLHHLLSPWRRRGASLLQVGLGSGLLPDFFWEAGFDVSALDPDPASLDASRAQTGPRVDYALGQPDHLPFDDSRFDYVVLVHLGLTPRLALGEALRAAARGVVVVEWNRLSLAALSPGPARSGVWPWDLTWLARKACPGCRMRLYSALPWPQFVWPGGRPKPPGKRPEEAAGRGKNSRGSRLFRLPRKDRGRRFVLAGPLGALMGLRIEISPVLLTPIGAVTDAPRARAYAGGAVVNRVEREVNGVRRADKTDAAAGGRRV